MASAVAGGHPPSATFGFVVENNTTGRSIAGRSCNLSHTVRLDRDSLAMQSALGLWRCRAIGAATVMAIAVTFAWSASAATQTRVALIVGNGAYKGVPELPNPTNDATAVAGAFLRLGFSVRLVTDATYDDMRRALLEFSQKARDSEMAVVFFAGHGIEVGGENWLIPVDAELKTDLDTEQEAISLRSVMLMVSAASKLGVVMLDACRNNPFINKVKCSVATRSVSRGLSRVEPMNNVLVAYAAKDGTTASDGIGDHSPFTTALLKHLETPGLEVTFLFRNVRDDVLAATNDEQRPFVYGSLSKEAIYLKPPPAVATPSAPDQIAWSMLKETTDEAALKRFIAQYPKSPLRADADARVAALATAKAAQPIPPEAAEVTWQLLKETIDVAALARFVAQFPNSALRKEAEARIAALTAPQAAKAAPPTSTNSHELVRSLQLELKRVGCFNGAVNGEIDEATRSASQSFTKLSSIKLPDELTPGAIKALRAVNKRVCPLVCPEGKRPAGDECVDIAAPRTPETRRTAVRNGKPSTPDTHPQNINRRPGVCGYETAASSMFCH
jgi:hypothetical protein